MSIQKVLLVEYSIGCRKWYFWCDISTADDDHIMEEKNLRANLDEEARIAKSELRHEIDTIEDEGKIGTIVLLQEICQLW